MNAREDSPESLENSPPSLLSVVTPTTGLHRYRTNIPTSAFSTASDKDGSVAAPSTQLTMENSRVAVIDEPRAIASFLGYSWSDGYGDETPAARRERWLQHQSFGPVVVSEGAASMTTTTALSTPMAYGAHAAGYTERVYSAGVWAQRNTGAGGICGDTTEAGSEVMAVSVAAPAGRRRGLTTQPRQATTAAHEQSTAANEDAAHRPGTSTTPTAAVVAASAAAIGGGDGRPPPALRTAGGAGGATPRVNATAARSLFPPPPRYPVAPPKDRTTSPKLPQLKSHPASNSSTPTPEKASRHAAGRGTTTTTTALEMYAMERDTKLSAMDALRRSVSPPTSSSSYSPTTSLTDVTREKVGEAGGAQGEEARDYPPNSGSGNGVAVGAVKGVANPTRRAAAPGTTPVPAHEQKAAAPKVARSIQGRQLRALVEDDDSDDDPFSRA